MSTNFFINSSIYFPLERKHTDIQLHMPLITLPTYTHSHTTVFGPLGFCPVSRHQKGKTNLDLLEQEIVSGSGISWAICKSAPWPRYITTPASHHSVFLQAGCPSCHPTNSVKALKAVTLPTYSMCNDNNMILHNLLQLNNMNVNSKFKHDYYKPTSFIYNDGHLHTTSAADTWHIIQYIFSSITWKMMRKSFFWACWTSSNFSSSRSMPSLVGTTRSSSAEKSSRLCCRCKQNNEIIQQNYKLIQSQNTLIRQHLKVTYKHCIINKRQWVAAAAAGP